MKKFLLGLSIVGSVALTIGMVNKPASAQSAGYSGIVSCACNAQKCCCGQAATSPGGAQYAKPNMTCE